MKTINERIKKCLVCEELFEDNTRPGNKVTCSRKCGDIRRKEKQRMEYREENPPKPNQRDLHYYDHYEYSFWLDDRIANNQAWKIAKPYATNKIEGIISGMQMREYYGGRRRHQERIDYDGDETGLHGVKDVNFGKGRKEDKEPSEVVSYTLTPEELAEYKKRLKKK